MRPIVSMLVWCATSFVACLLILLPTRLSATEPAAPQAERPKLVIEGCEVRVRPVGEETASGAVTVAASKPLDLEIIATNPTDHRVTITPTVSLSVSRFSRSSRVLSAPTEAWRTQESIALSPGETKSIKLPHAAEIGAGMLGNVILSSGADGSIAALQLEAPATER